MRELKTANGVITEDPAANAGLGTAFQFASIPIHHESNGRAEWLERWESFEGVLLSVAFVDAGQLYIEGSAVMIAPGVALCATHVIQPRLDAIMAGHEVPYCFGILSGGMRIWKVKHVTLVPSSDLSILGLGLASAVGRDEVLLQAMVTTRTPAVGEKLWIAGFKAGQASFPRDARFNGSVLACTGLVTAQYPSERDRVLMPWPCVEVSCPTWGGMSGGPAFDASGAIVGLLSRGLSAEDDRGPSYVSLLWPALVVEFLGGWPGGMFPGRSRLLDLDPRLCSIDRREAITEHVDPTTGASVVRYRMVS